MKSRHVSFPERVSRNDKKIEKYRRDQPGPMHAFNRLSQTALEAGSLPARTKALLALVLAVAARCEASIGRQARALVELGACRAEVEEALAVAVWMGGAPSLVHSVEALSAFDQFQEAVARAS